METCLSTGLRCVSGIAGKQTEYLTRRAGWDSGPAVQMDPLVC